MAVSLEKSSKPASPHAGHRQRLKARFLQNPASVPDYELLELVLYWVFPRQDTKALAKKLLQEVGSLGKVVFSSSPRLKKHGGGAAYYTFQCLKEVCGRLLREDIQRAPLLNNTHRLREYCTTVMAYDEKEQIRIFFVDKKYYLLHEEVVASGTLDEVSLHPREVMKKILEVNAMGILLVHNHPSGDPTPSSADISLTHYLRDHLIPFGIKILDHLIVGKHGSFSFREKGLL